MNRRSPACTTLPDVVIGVRYWRRRRSQPHPSVRTVSVRLNKGGADLRSPILLSLCFTAEAQLICENLARDAETSKGFDALSKTAFQSKRNETLLSRTRTWARVRFWPIHAIPRYKRCQSQSEASREFSAVCAGRTARRCKRLVRAGRRRPVHAARGRCFAAALANDDRRGTHDVRNR